ncbi:MAG: hypothetical protein CL930_07060 [Deltaproteobacteria bacterium]|nr:hypothetical protein [Deltaproteobacteria bacterium]
MKILDKKILIVTGKGGTGKTTTAAAIGLWAARRGKNTLLVECNGASHLCPLFRRSSAGYSPVSVHPGLSIMSITSEEAIEDYIVQQIKIRKLYSLVFRNRIMSPFMDAVPGLHDAVHLGKVFDLSRETNKTGQPVWDLIVVDAPATGHGLSMLASPRSMMELTRKGPIFQGVKQVHDVISDPTKTGIILTCLPEEMPVSETQDLFEKLGPQNRLVLACVLNEITPAVLPDEIDWSVVRPQLMESEHPEIHKAADLTERWSMRIEDQERARTSLKSTLGTPVVDLPFLFDRSLAFSELQVLSQALETAMGRA